MLKKLFTAAILTAASMLGAAELLFDGAKAGAWASDAEVKDGVVTMNLNYTRTPEHVGQLGLAFGKARFALANERVQRLIESRACVAIVVIGSQLLFV